MLVSVLVGSIATVACFLGYKKFKPGKKSGLKEGDYALLRHSYYSIYPRIPKNQALTVDRIEGEMATVCYMEPTEIHRTQVKKDALRKVS